MTIKEARELAGLTHQEAVKLIGVPPRTLQNWEDGLSQCPPYIEKVLIERLTKLAQEKKNSISNP